MWCSRYMLTLNLRKQQTGDAVAPVRRAVRVQSVSTVPMFILICVVPCRCQRIANSCRTRYPRLSEVLKVCMANANTRGTACDCAVVPQGSALQCQKQAKQLNALLLSACTNKLPPTLNLDKLKAADSSCLAVLSASGQAVTLDTVINDLTEECVNVAASGGCFGTKRGPVSAVAARCSLAGQCAAKIIDTLECSGLSCLLNIVHYTCPRECYHHQQPQQQQHCLLIWATEWQWLGNCSW
jgi:hypothetical protein